MGRLPHDIISTWLRVAVLAAALAATRLEPAAAQPAFPVEIETRYGMARIERAPERVVSINYLGQDFLLALGVKPVAVREFYGGYPYAAWPWAQEALGDAQPVVLRGEIDVERIALLKPDLIIAQWSGVSEREYRLLSAIAPTLAPEPGVGDYGMSWQSMLRRIGRAVGRASAAEKIIAGLDGRIAGIASAHPEWRGKTAVFATTRPVGAYTSADIRGRLIEALGFKTPEAIEEMKPFAEFYTPLSREDLSPIDADVVIWFGAGENGAALDEIPLHRTMRAKAEGREIYADMQLGAALTFSSPLSLGYALDRLTPMLERAMDGDPTTPVHPATAEATQ